MEPEVQSRLEEHYGRDALRERLVPYVQAGHHGFAKERLEDGTLRDGFGAVIKEGNIFHVLQHPLSSPSLKGYNWPEPEGLDDWDAVAKTYKEASSSYRICGFAFGLFERSSLMRGMQNILMEMLEHAGFVDELMDGITDIHLRVMDLIVERIPVEAYFGGDDWSDQRGPIMGMNLWRRFSKPGLRKMIDHCHSRGLPYIVNSCGNVLPLIDDLLEMGLDGLESLQPEAMDVYELKRRVAGRMVLIGGLGSQSVLPFGTPEEVAAETRRLLSDLGKGGGYVIGPAKGLMPDVSTENAVALIDTVWSQNRIVLK
jgi:uroporphyrinogen decarboxylase